MLVTSMFTPSSFLAGVPFSALAPSSPVASFEASLFRGGICIITLWQGSYTSELFVLILFLRGFWFFGRRIGGFLNNGVTLAFGSLGMTRAGQN